ncbi:MAG: HpsJ family protein [Cyanobacteria bacterium CAN_BIN43]|nr:HpsJ family protein [Cyanobacteria bacterium CAN_BIN43]
MRSTKSGLSSSVLVSRTLKTVGVVIVLATLLDIGIAAIPYNFADRLWQIGFTTSLVDRGIVPMVGIVLFLTGFWIDSNLENDIERKSLFADPRFWALALASLLGAIYLILFPLHLSNIGWSNQQALEQISQKAKQAETELGNQLNTEVNSQRSQINQLLATSDEQLGQLVTNNQLSKEQADLIRKFKADPKAVEPFLNKRIEETKTQLQTRIATEKLAAEKKAKTESLKSGLRIGISSLLLAAGFITIGWSGLRNIGQP